MPVLTAPHLNWSWKAHGFHQPREGDLERVLHLLSLVSCGKVGRGREGGLEGLRKTLNSISLLWVTAMGHHTVVTA